LDGETRTRHPYFMYEAIQGQPDAFARVAALRAPDLADAGPRIGACERLYVIGIGTSLHAAQTGEGLIAAYGAGMPVRAVHSFDFALYGPPLGARDGVIAVSHRGTKRYTVEALARANEAGCLTVLITGEGGATERPAADITLRTVTQEPSAAHTISYTTSVAVLAGIAGQVGLARTHRPPFPPTLLSDRIPQAMRTALGTEDAMASFASEHVGRRRIWLVGGGPGAIVAHEIALKIKETSYLQAEGLGVEPMLHGPLLCAEPEDLFIVIAPEGPAQARVVEFGGAIREIGAPYLVVSDGTPHGLRQGAAGWCTVPAVPEPFSPLTCLVPLQLLTYHLALIRGTNPDVFRMDDPRFARIRQQIPL